MPLVGIHLSKGGISAGRKKTATGKATVGSVAVEGESLRDLSWLTAADVKVLAFG